MHFPDTGRTVSFSLVLLGKSERGWNETEILIKQETKRRVQGGPAQVVPSIFVPHCLERQHSFFHRVMDTVEENEKMKVKVVEREKMID